jgi:putative ABC transport system permease protein
MIRRWFREPHRAGALCTARYASTRHELVVIPALAWGGGTGAAVLISTAAGLWPTPRAARMSPAQALWRM